MKNYEVKLCEKFSLTIAEAAAYLGIGEKKLRNMIENNRQARWYIQNGVKYMIKREKFEAFLNEATII